MMGGLTWSVLIGTAAVDSINPCTLAVLLLLLTGLVASAERKRNILLVGLAFTSAIYISYFFMGLGIYSAVQAAKIAHTFYYIVIALAIIISIMNIKDYFKYKPGFFAIEIPMKWRPTIKKILTGVASIPGAAVVGFLCSLFLLPCSSGPYIIILGLLAKTSTRATAIPLLLIYNIIFIMPMIIITLLVHVGKTKLEEVSSFRVKYIKLIHLISGIIMLSLAVLLIYSIYAGWI